MKLFNKLYYYFNKAFEAEQAREKIRRVKTFIAFSWFLALILFLYAIGTYFKLGHVQLSVIELVIGIISFCVPFIYKRTGNLDFSAGITVGCGVAILSAASFYSGGINSPVVFWVALCPMCAAMIRGRGSVIFWGVVSISVPILFSIFDSYIQAFPYLIRDEEIILALRKRAIYGTITFSIVLNWMYKKFIDEMVEQLTDANLQIQNFIRVLGHDIANPLTIVLGNSSMGEKFASSDKEKRLWQRTNKASITIDEILKEVLTLQAIESGKIDLNLVPVSVQSIVDRGLFIFSEKLKTKELSIEYNPKEELWVMADEVSLSNQVLNNLISNAIKFSKEGSKIVIETELVEDNVIISVKDSGVGIPKDILDNLFNYHYKTSRRGTNGESGTGFGMPLVKYFVEKYGGRLEVETRPAEEYKEDHGTLFKVILKRAPSQFEGVEFDGPEESETASKTAS